MRAPGQDVRSLLDAPVRAELLQVRGRAWLAAGVVVLLAGLASVANIATYVPKDFKAAIYYPARAVLDGNNPYAVSEHLATYPLGESFFPLYAPSHLLLSLPFSLLPIETAALLWAALGIGMLVLAARVGTRGVAALALVVGLALLSRPGRTDILLGQVALPYVLATWGCWRWTGRRPWLAAICLALVLGKPPFGLPLIALLLLRRQWSVVVRGVAVFVAMCVPVTVVLLMTTGGQLVEDVTSNLEYAQESLQDRPGAARLADVLSLVVRSTGWEPSSPTPWTLLAFLLVVGGCAAVLARAMRAAPVHAAPMLVLLGVTTVVCLPHQDYDLLLMVWPMVTVAAAWRAHPALAAAGALSLVTMAVPARSVLRLFGYETRPGVLEATDPGLGAVESVTTVALLVFACVAVATLLRGRHVGVTHATPGTDVMHSAGKEGKPH